MISTIACPGSFISLYKQMYLETQTCHILAKSLFFSIFEKLEKPQWLMFIISGPAVAKWVGGRIPGSDGWQDFSGQNVKDLSFFFSFCGFFFFFFCLQHWQNTFTKLLQWQVISHQSVTLPRASPPAQCELWSLAKGEWHLESTKSFFPLFLAAQCSMWDLSSPARDWTCVPCRGSMET